MALASARRAAAESKRALACTLFVALVGYCFAGSPAQEPAVPRKQARLDYTVRCVLDGVRDRLEVDLKATGLDPEQRDLAFQLPNWGEWLDFDEYYVTGTRGTPPVRHDLENRFYWRPQLPDAWNGELAFHYEIPIVARASGAHASRGLLPWRMETYVNSYSANTLMGLIVGDELQAADRHVEFVAPEGWTVATGWGGASAGRQALAIPPGADNTAVIFGVPAGASSSNGAGGHIEVVQFGRHADRTAAVLELARAVRTAAAEATGTPAPADEHVYILEPGMGGTHTDGAVDMGHPALENGTRFEPGTACFIAHELYHAWLPGVLAHGEDGLEWFFEGFTDYFATWHLAQQGLITPQQFAFRLRFLELLARESPACGKVAFGDKSVNWREPDAEQIAYKGGAVLAFHLDVELRARGGPGLPLLFRDLARDNGGKYTLDALRNWCAAHGLAEAWAAYVAAPALPDVGDDLVRLGFVETREGEARVIKARDGDPGAFFRFTPPAR